jgi:hypothetical protein
MSMKLTINISNKAVYAIVIFFILSIVSIGAYAYTTMPNPGHGGDSVVVTINSEEMTLQEAIDSGIIGGTGGIQIGKTNAFTPVISGGKSIWTSSGTNLGPGRNCMASLASFDVIVPPPSLMVGGFIQTGACRYNSATGDIEGKSWATPIICTYICTD